MIQKPEFYIFVPSISESESNVFFSDPKSVFPDLCPKTTKGYVVQAFLDKEKQ